MTKLDELSLGKPNPIKLEEFLGSLGFLFMMIFTKYGSLGLYVGVLVMIMTVGVKKSFYRLNSCRKSWKKFAI